MNKRSSGVPFSWVFLFFLALPSAFAIQYPVSPSEPVVNSPGTKASPNAKSPRIQQKKVLQSNNKPYQVRITLGSGDSLLGIIYAPENITFSHMKNGLTYTKTVDTTQVRSIKFLTYNRKKISEKNGETIFAFEPTRLLLELKNNQRYETSQIFTFLKKIPVETGEGNTTLYSYFADAWLGKKGWREVESRDKEYHKSRAHPQAAVLFELFESTTSHKGGQSEE